MVENQDVVVQSRTAYPDLPKDDQNEIAKNQIEIVSAQQPPFHPATALSL
jgi:hypothetical protein